MISLTRVRSLLRSIPHPRPRSRGQAFLELAIILPVLLILLLGLVEVVVYVGRYLDILDLTREAARFASVRDPSIVVNASQWDCGPAAAGEELPFDFYYNTACIFSQPNTGSCSVSDPEFCNGLNTYVDFDPAFDDIVISVFTITNWTDRTPEPFPNPAVTDMHPRSSGGPRLNNYWAFSDHDSDTAHNANWSKNCEDPGTVIRNQPYYNATRINDILSKNSGSPSKGYIAVEFYYCYEQVLALPILTDFIPNPMRIHAYTLMPLPFAQPSPTPRP